MFNECNKYNKTTSTAGIIIYFMPIFDTHFYFTAANGLKSHNLLGSRAVQRNTEKLKPEASTINIMVGVHFIGNKLFPVQISANRIL